MTIIETFLNSGYFKPKTQEVYKSNLKQYFKVINKKPETYFKQEQQEYKQDIMNYFRYLIEHKSHSIKHKIRTLKSFLIFNEIELKTIFWIKILKTQPTRPIAIDKKPTKQILKEILTHAQAKDKAWILLAITTGLRISEILNLKLTEIDLTGKEPYTIDISPDTKTKNRRIAFTNEETKQAINQWLKVRTQYIKAKKIKGTHLTGHTTNPTKTDKLFPFTYNTAGTIWKNLLIKSGHNQQDKSTSRKRYIYRIHTLRKYFKSQINHIPEISETITETLLGHEEYLKQAYNKYEPEELRDFYKKAIPELNLYETTTDLTETNKQIKDLYNKISEQQELIEIMKKATPFHSTDYFEEAIDRITESLIKSTTKEEFKQFIEELKQNRIKSKQKQKE